jgi:tripartite-type tricarboxylate transporter receptor subunit TctC
MFAPKGTPEAVVSVLREASRKAAADEKFIGAMHNIGQDVAYLDQPEFRAFWEADAKRVQDAVRQIGKV